MFSFIGSGLGHTLYGKYSSILAGCNNTIVGSTCFNNIITGKSNYIPNSYSYVIISGNCIQADRQCTTFVNNLSIKNIPTSGVGLPSGSVYSLGGVLKIIA